MKMIRMSRGGRRSFAGTVALAAALGALGAFSPAVQAATSPDWTKQTPATHPPGLWGEAMAYDAATVNVVLFGGESFRGGTWTANSATWTWDGSTWTMQHPATKPLARYSEGMAYDAATGNVVMFGGQPAQGQAKDLHDTWIWG